MIQSLVVKVVITLQIADFCRTGEKRIHIKVCMFAHALT